MIRTVTTEPFLTVEQKLKDGEEYFINVLRDRGLFMSAKAMEKNAIPVIRGEKTRIPHEGIVAIRVIPVNWKPVWGSARIRHDQYRFYVDCLIKTSQSYIVDEYIMVFALAVANWLLDFPDLQPTIVEADQKAFDSWIDNCEFGYTKGQVWRVARLDYWMKLQHNYVQVGGLAPACVC